METGFLEYGLAALIGYSFVNLVLALVVLGEAPSAAPGEGKPID